MGQCKTVTRLTRVHRWGFGPFSLEMVFRRIGSIPVGGFGVSLRVVREFGEASRACTDEASPAGLVCEVHAAVVVQLLVFQVPRKIKIVSIANLRISVNMNFS